MNFTDKSFCHIILFIFATTLFVQVQILIYPSQAFAQNNKSNYNESGLDPKIKELFIDVNNTIPSIAAEKRVSEAIKQRISCFEDNFSYRDRVNICMTAYRENLVTIARQIILGRPEAGLFIKNVYDCPIMYNLCKGQSDTYDLTQEDCEQFERQCVDLMFDRYWRGSPVYNNIEVGIEKQ